MLAFLPSVSLILYVYSPGSSKVILENAMSARYPSSEPVCTPSAIVPTVSVLVVSSASFDAGASPCGVSVNSNSSISNGRLWDLDAPRLTVTRVGFSYLFTKVETFCLSSGSLPSALVYTTDLTSRLFVPSFLSTCTVALYRVSSYVTLWS